MSSTYNLLCLGHNPAIRLLGFESDLREAIEDVRRDGKNLAGHERCDILAGRFSYPLVEVGCFGNIWGQPSGCKSTHRSVNWEDVDVLRLVLSAYRTGSVPEKLLDPFLNGCWTIERLLLISRELGMASDGTSEYQDH